MTDISNERISAVVGIVIFIFSLVLENIPFLSVLEILILGSATILAIVVSVGLLSVQLAATEYTPLVVRSKSSYSYILTYFWRFIFAIVVGLISYLLISSSFPPIAEYVFLLEFGPPVLFGITVGTVAYATISIKDLYNETLSAIDRKQILERVSSDISIKDISKYIAEKRREDSAVSHPFIIIYTMGKKSIEEEDTHASKEIISQLTTTTKKIISEIDSEEQYRLVEEEGLADLFDFWRDIGALAVENEMRAVAEYWIDSFSSVLESCFEHAPTTVVVQSLSTYEEVVERKISAMGLSDDPADSFGLLQQSLTSNRLDVQDSVLSVGETLIRSAIETNHNRFSEEVGKILDEYFESWENFVSSDMTRSEKEEMSERYSETLSEVIDLFSNPLEMHNIELMGSHSYLVEQLEEIGKTAANNDSPESVRMVVSIIVDLYLSTRNPKRTGAITNKVSKERYAEVISSIANEGRDNAVDEVFTKFSSLPEIDMSEYDSNLKAYSDLNDLIDETEDWNFVEFIDFYRGRKVIQDLLEELAEEADIECEIESSTPPQKRSNET